MRFSISIHQLDSDGFDAAGLRDYLARAEELGFEAGWVLEQTIGPAPLIAPLEMLAYAAACTERLRLGVAVLVSSLHDPLQLASSITAVDRLSHGRLDIGVAPGGGFRKFAAFGVDGDDVHQQLHRRAGADEGGLVRRAAGHVRRPFPPGRRSADPAQARAAAASADLVRRQAPKALARAVRHGDAFLGAGSSTTAKFAEAVHDRAPRARRAGQGPGAFPIGKRVYLMVDDDPTRARERVVAGLRRIYGAMPGIDDVPVSGTVDDVVAGLREVIDAGAETILLNPVGGDVAEDREQMERLAAEVIPQLS